MGSKGHDIFTIDNDDTFNPDLCKDMLLVEASELPKNIEILWASPPCEGFSVAVIGRNWTHEHQPKTDSAKLGVKLLEKTISLIEETQPKWWFIENPRGKMRRMPQVQGFIRHTITYCQYGDTRMKPTDIWTNAPWFIPRPACKNGSPCHVAAPRGSQTGTQGMGSYASKSEIPAELFEDIIIQHTKHLHSTK